ncbi:chromate transporter [Natranaerobius thermophilus]|uniref:Chromate transporter n=1 Tax=Natranaerobius thermophilus (strain ATCC BAA-1301 / DSM 18059 / JW/NM-WN-LF) TaxID=457570 RepID=B2A4Q8_NATTJ|nr:chromate transporter [Natranaerobius thermophilus]ACB83830.1 Chromate transporter [Natranaerobius thermophilus JW/NM-WN-LF]
MLLLDLFITFVKIGLFSFGGGYVMIPLIREEIINTKGWLSETVFLDVIAIAEMTPGPIAINSATFVGFQVAGFWGAVVSTLGVITPSIILILISAKFLQKYYHKVQIKNFFAGVRPAVIGLILSAGIVIAQSAVVDLKGLFIAVLVLIIMIVKQPHPILMILVSGVLGLILY